MMSPFLFLAVDFESAGSSPVIALYADNRKVENSCFDTGPASLYHLAFIDPTDFKNGEIQMSVYDSKDLMSFNAASREFDVPAVTLELAAARGALRVIQLDEEREGERREGLLLRPDVEQFVKRTIKRGAGNRVVTRIR